MFKDAQRAVKLRTIDLEINLVSRRESTLKDHGTSRVSLHHVGSDLFVISDFDKIIPVRI